MCNMPAFEAAMLCGWSLGSLAESGAGDSGALVPSPALAVAVLAGASCGALCCKLRGGACGVGFPTLLVVKVPMLCASVSWQEGGQRGAPIGFGVCNVFSGLCGTQSGGLAKSFTVAAGRASLILC